MIRTNGRGIVYGEVWFGEEPPRDAGVDIVQYRQRETPIDASRNQPFLTLVSDLSAAADAIASGFGKDCRHKIRRADSRDGLRMELIVEPESRIDEFRAFFDAFAQEKSIVPSDPDWLLAACRAGQLVLSGAWSGAEVLVWHAYVLRGQSVRLQHSASYFRNRESSYRALVGRANRWLHWRDMLKFKEMGILRYDWGGMFEDESTPERAGVNRFKRDFGGRDERGYDCTVPVTLKGRVYLPLREAWRRRFRKVQATP